MEEDTKFVYECSECGLRAGVDTKDDLIALKATECPICKTKKWKDVKTWE